MQTLRMAYYPLLAYDEALALQKQHIRSIDGEMDEERLLLLQHPPTYTVGTSRHEEHLLLNKKELEDKGIGLFEIDRGGDITYHGPGQLVGYPLLYLDAAGLDLHDYLRKLEQSIIDLLADLGVRGHRKDGYTGVWVADRKIAAIGVKFNKCKYRRGFVTSHGFSLNIKHQLEHFGGIIPCGIRDFGITSLEECMGWVGSMEEMAQRAACHLSRIFGRQLLGTV